MVALGGAGLFVQELLVLFLASLVVKMDLQHGEFTTNDMVRFNIFQAFGNIVVWGLIAPSLDIFDL